MKELNTLVGNAPIKQLEREILLNTKGQYMKESNNLAGDVTIKQLHLAKHKMAIHEKVNDN